jgi:hypothetical protein
MSWIHNDAKVWIDTLAKGAKMQKVFESSFEEGFYDFEGISELTCPNGWTPVWVESTEAGLNHRPEYDFKDRDLGHPEVRSGRWAANFFTTFATHDGALYRRFRVGIGRGIRVSVWCMGVTHDPSGIDGGHGMQIGIDPTGGTDHTAATVVYGDWWSSYMKDEGWAEGVWKQVDAETVSQTEEITVFLRAKCDFKAEINASHWDDFVLELGDASEVKVPAVVAAAAPSEMTAEQLEAFIRQIVRDELSKNK